MPRVSSQDWFSIVLGPVQRPYSGTQRGEKDRLLSTYQHVFHPGEPVNLDISVNATAVDLGSRGARISPRDTLLMFMGPTYQVRSMLTATEEEGTQPLVGLGLGFVYTHCRSEYCLALFLSPRNWTAMRKPGVLLPWLHNSLGAINKGSETQTPLL